MSSRPSDVSSLFIRAGAGAGKTTQLILSFMQFVKSFRESQGRFPRVVLTTFTNKATQEVKERLLVNALKDDGQDIFEYINRKSMVHISTIHGLLHLLIMQNADLLELPQDLKIIDRTHSNRVLKKNIYQLIKSHPSYADLLESYPFRQLADIAKQAVDLKYQHAGLNYVNESQLRALTEKKLSRITDKLQEIFTIVQPVPDKWQDYFRFLKDYQALVLEKNVDAAILHFENETKKPPFLTKNPPFPIEAHLLIEELRDPDLLIAQDTTSYQKRHEKLNHLFNQFVDDLFTRIKEHKKKTGELTTDDLENYALLLIQSFPEAAKDFSNSWDYFMVDEYQDTSPLQVIILNQIVGDKPCFIVGDPQQSIYLFRGARSEVFDEKEAQFRAENKEVKVLNRNYRSEPRLMNFINEFFLQFRQSFRPMEVKPTTLEAPLVEQAFYIQTYDEVAATLKQIQHLMSQGVEAKDICVLSRRNSTLVEIAQQAYRARIPVQLQTAAGFESKREVLDLIAFLKFLINPYDSENLVTLARSPWLWIEDQQLVDLAQSVDGRFSLWSALTQTDLIAVQALRKYLDDFSEQGATLALKNFIVESGFVSFSELLDPTGKREANIWKLLTLLTDAEKRSGFSLSSFVEDQFQSLQADLSSSAREAQPVIQPDRVSLLTVHASKGLEFPHVIVVGFSDRPLVTNVMNLAFDLGSQQFSLSVYDEELSRLLPSAWAVQVRREFNQRELLENERVLYVAMTRAEQSVTLIAEVARAGEKKIITSESWFKKVNWPLESSTTEAFTTHVEFDDETLEQYERGASQMQNVREKKFLPHTNEVTSHSVTELISTEPADAAQSVHFDRTIGALKKAQKGTDLHRLFESLKYLSWTELEPDLNESEKKLVRYLITQKEVDLQQVLEKGFNEWGFGVKARQGVLQGQIDAWAELDQEVHILDYKTGSVEYAEKAFTQLSVYTYALLKMNKISESKTIVHSIIYPVDQKIIQKRFTDAAEFRLKEPTLGELF